MNSRRIVIITRWVLAFSALAGIVLLYRHWPHVNPTTVALTLLLLILVLAAEWGLRYAVAVSLAATACYNFFFLPPLGTFTISDPQNWLALFAFLSTAIIASRLSQRARDRADDSRSRQKELEILFHLSRELLQTENVATLVSSAPSSVASVTGARSGMLYLLDGDRLYQAGKDDISEIELPHLRKLATTLSKVSDRPDEIQVPLRSGVRPRGLLILRGVSLSPETSEAIGGLISISIDRAQALENLARGEAAKESERLRTLMIDSITHELRTPLTSIKGAATALLSGVVSQESNHELLNIIDEESDRLNNLVTEAVEMAQLDAQQVQMHFASVNLLQLIEQAGQTCAWVEESHPLRVDVSTALVVHADGGFLKKVICNLLENAAKYSKPDTPITISAQRRGGSIAISVADRGVGIDPSEQALIFERFYRARSHGEGTAGTGMGLAISRSIIEAHRGHIDVTSQPGQGSVFTFTIPISTPDGNETPEWATSSNAPD
jgi:two-component system sensor histidine kinase KdpD